MCGLGNSAGADLVDEGAAESTGVRADFEGVVGSGGDEDGL